MPAECPRPVSSLPLLAAMLTVLAASAPFAPNAEAAPSGTRSPSRPATAPAAPAPAAGCAARLDSLERLHSEDRADYLDWDFAAYGCRAEELYRARFAQGVGALLAGEPRAAARHLEAAQALGGPRDEELLYHLWTARRRLGDRAGMASAARELHARAPESPWLARLLEEWRAARRPAARGFRGAFESRIARSDVGSLDNDVSTRLQGELRQARGGHRFRETAALSLKANAGARAFEGLQADFGGEWSHGGLSLEAGWALGYDARNAKDTLLGALSGGGPALRYAGWNGRMAHAALGFTVQGASGAGLGARLAARVLSRDWWAAGITLTPAWIAGDWSLAGLVDLQHHGMRWSVTQADSLEGAGPVTVGYALDGMQTIQASLAPGRRAGDHDLSLGLGYALARYASTLTFGFEGLVEAERESAWEHSLALSPSWRWSLGRGLRFHLGASLGYDFEERAASVATCREWLRGFCAEETYGADAGFSLSF